MSIVDKIKSFFSGGSSTGADEHAGHDHSAQEPATPMPPADPAGMPMSDSDSDAGEDRPA